MIDVRKIIDISMDLNEKTVVWIHDSQPELKPIARQPANECNFTWLNFSAHAGTHIDAPYYLFNDKWTSDQVPFDRLIGRCEVLDLTYVVDTIESQDLASFSIKERIVLLKTRNSFDVMKKYNPEHVELSVKAAEFLAELGVTTVGFDYQSFERGGSNVIHRIFMERNMICIDNLRLGNVENRYYNLICLPIKVTGIDAAPCRAILEEVNL